MNIKNIDKLNIHKVVEDANKWYDEHGRDEKFIILENMVLDKNNPYYDYVFAKYARGANIKTFENAILKSHSHKYIYYFGRDVEKASYKIFINKDADGNQIFVVMPMVQMPANKEEKLMKFWKDVKFKYNNHGLFIVELNGGEKDGGLNLFYYDEYTKERVQNVIDNEYSFEPLFLYYAVESGNYKLVKTLLDYNKFNKVNYRDFALDDIFNTSDKHLIAHNRPYTTLSKEAIFTNRDIFKLLDSKINKKVEDDDNMNM